MIILQIIGYVIAAITIFITLKWMLLSVNIIVEYFKSIKQAGLDQEYHLEYLKIIGTFCINFFIFKIGLRQIFDSSYGMNTLFFIHNAFLFNSLILIWSIALLIGVKKLNNYITVTFKY